MTFGSMWMPLFGDDFWDSERVADMDGDAVSLYLWLLWRQFKLGSLPPPEKLRRLPHRWQVQWDAVWPQVAPCFDVNGEGRLENAKCAEIREAAMARSRKASKNGKRGGRPPKSEPESEPKATAKRPVSKSRTEPKASAKPEQSSERSGEEKRESEAPSVLSAASAADASPPDAEAPTPRQRKPATGPHAEVAAWFAAEYEREVGKPYAFEGAKDGKAVKDLLARAGPGGVPELQERGRLFFADPWHRKSGLTLTRFLAAWNALAKPAISNPETSARAWLEAQSREQPRTVDVEGRRTA